MQENPGGHKTIYLMIIITPDKASYWSEHKADVVVLFDVELFS